MRLKHLLSVFLMLITCAVGNVWGVEVNIGTYASSHSWVNETTQYRTINADANITITLHDNNGSDNGSNTGKFYSSNNSWRLYTSESSYLTITCADGYELESFAITFTAGNNGSFKYGTSTISSGTSINVSGTSVSTGSVTGQTTGKKPKKGNIQITAISVVYSATTPPCTPLGQINGSFSRANLLILFIPLFC